MASKIRGRNEGSISQRSNGSWRAQISLNGKRISQGFSSKTEALAWLRQMQTQHDQGFDYQRGKITLGEYLQEWLATHSSSLRISTFYQYGLTIKNHILPNIGHIQLKDLNLSTVDRFYSDLLGSGISPRTVRLVHAVLHKSLNKAVRYGLLNKNPANGATLPRYTHDEMIVLDASNVSSFLIAAQGSRYETLFYLAVHTGMRQGELFGLKWSDLQWNTGNLHVQRQVRRVPGHSWNFVEPKTKAGRRMIKIGEGALQALRVHKQQQEYHKDIAGERWQEHGLIFPSTVGTPDDPSNLRVEFLRVLKDAGLPIIRFHDLRHTAASLMLNNNIPPIVVSKRLGHSKPSVTLDIYGHLYHEMQDDAAKIMDELVTPIKVDLLQEINGNNGR